MFFEKKEVPPDDAQEDDSESSYSRRYRKELEGFEVNEGAEGIASIKEEIPYFEEETAPPEEEKIEFKEETILPKEKIVPFEGIGRIGIVSAEEEIPSPKETFHPKEKTVPFEEETILPKEKIVPFEKRIMRPVKEIIPPKEEIAPHKIATKMPTELEFKELNSKIDSIITWIRQFYERFNYVCDNVKKIRAMGLENKKKISSITEDLTKAIGIANGVSPEKLRTDNKRLDMKISTLSEKFEANREFMNNVLDEVKEIKREANIFIGAEEELSKLNKEVKSDLTEIQKLGAKVRLDADKSEKIFIELRKVLSEVQRTNDEFNNFNTVSSELRSEIEKLKTKYASLDESIKKTLLISEKNKKETERLASGVRIEDIKKIREHETKLDVFQEVANNLAIQILELKSKYDILENSIKKTISEKNKKETEKFVARPIESEKLKEYEVSELKRKMISKPEKIEKNLVKKPSNIEKQSETPPIPLLIKTARIQKESIKREKKPAFEKLPKKSAFQDPYKPKEISEFPELPELPPLKQKEPTTIKKKLITNPSF